MGQREVLTVHAFSVLSCSRVIALWDIDIFSLKKTALIGREVRALDL